MGSVPDLYTTGDNDSQIEPEQFYRHYLYCDACGSFELSPWTAAEDAPRLERTRRRLALVAATAVVVTVLAAAGVLTNEVLPPRVILAAALLVGVGSIVARGVLGAKLEPLGMRCDGCAATFAYGTPFFSDLEANPRQLKVADVPRPLGRSPFQIGRSVAGEPSPAPARQPS